MTRSMRALFALVAGLGLLTGAHATWATSLHLNLVDTDGNPVQVSRAELLLVAWMIEEARVDLELSANGLTLDLEREWLRSRWPLSSPSPPARNPFDYHMGVYLYLEAPPLLASIQSHRFHWPGRVPGDPTGREGTTTIAFPRGQEVVVPAGEDVNMTLVFRPKVSRQIRFVSPQAEPWPDLRVHASMFWSDANNCAILTGRDSLGSHVTDAAGWVELPDGEFEYALDIVRGPRRFHGSLVEDSRTPWRLVNRLLEPSEVVVRELPIEPLEIRVRRGGEPAVGVYLRGMAAICVCGACDGPLGTTDEAGRIRLDSFRPEAYDEVWLVDGDTEVWRSFAAGGVVEIDL